LYLRRKRDHYLAYKLFLLAIFLTGQLVFCSSEYFNTVSLKITGNQVLEIKELEKFARIKEGDNLLYLRLIGVKQRLEAHPWVKEAKVSFLYPRKLRAKITERYVSLALSPSGAVRYGTAEDGMVLVHLKKGEEKGLPLIIVDEPVKLNVRFSPARVKAVLRCYSQLSPGEQKRVDNFNIRRDKLEMQFGAKGQLVKFGTFDNLDKKTRILKTLLTYLEKEGKLGKVQYIDFTRGKVLVKFE